MAANLTWDHQRDWDLLRAHGGWEFGSTLEEALPKLRAKKQYEAKATIDVLALKDSDIFAEIGPGFGFEAAEIAPRVMHAHLFDISQSFQNFCRKNVREPNVSFHLMKPGDLSGLPNKGINKIYSGGVFIHFNTYDLFRYLSAISSALPPNGKLLFNYRNLCAKDVFNHPDWPTSEGLYRKEKTNLFGLMYWHSPQTIATVSAAVGLRIENIVGAESDYPLVLCSR